MDPRTLASYDEASAKYASDWEDRQAPPYDMYALLQRYFIASGATIDVGCGSGRDTAWLAAHGYAATGCDASQGLLAEARRRHPGVGFREGVLPELGELAGSAYDNVLCETVLMHLPLGDVQPAVRRLRALLKPGGVMYLSWRVTEGDSVRDQPGRLYTAFTAQDVKKALDPRDQLWVDAEETSASSGKKIHRLVVQTARQASAG